MDADGQLEKIWWNIFTWQKAFCSRLNIEDAADVGYRHSKRVHKEFNNKNIGNYLDLYVQSDTLLLAHVF